MNIKQMIGFKKGILIGSRALRVNKLHSDFDIVVKEKDISDDFRDKFQYEVHSNYFNEVMPLGNFELLKIRREDLCIDLIIISDDADYDTYQNAIDSLKKLPKYMVEDKVIRVALFEKALLHYGFRESNDNIPF